MPQQLFFFLCAPDFPFPQNIFSCFYFLPLSFGIIQEDQKSFCFNLCNKGVNIPDVFSAEMPNRVTRCDS